MAFVLRTETGRLVATISNEIAYKIMNSDNAISMITKNGKPACQLNQPMTIDAMNGQLSVHAYENYTLSPVK